MKHNPKAIGEATIVDVAREAGVSYATVSRVINDKDHVRPDKRERVIDAMTRLGYVVNRQARSLAGGRSYVIGLLVHDLANSYIGEIVRGLDEELTDSQYDLMLYTTHRRKASELTYVSLLSRGLVDGLLMVSPSEAADYLETLQQRQTPLVLIDHYGAAEDTTLTVNSTNYQGAYEAVTYLLGLGHRRIGVVTGRLTIGCAVERLAGYRAALAAAAVAEEPLLVREGDFTKERGHAAARELLALPQPPTAIFAGNDLSAFGVMEAAREHGLRIPEDLSVIGFDDIPPAAHVHPALTTVRQPLQEMGHVAMRMLLAYIEHGVLPNNVFLPTELVIRGSCTAAALGAADGWQPAPAVMFSR